MELITIIVEKKTIVKPAEDTPREALWLSNVDLITTNVHVPSVYFYSRGRTGGTGSLKDALAKILVPYYPLAGRLRRGGGGRLRRGGGGRLEVDCNAEGVLFVEAETTATLAELADFAPTLQMRKLVPAVDRSGDVSSFPLLLLQITYFKCGGVALGVGVEHRLVDGVSGFTFVNLWSEVARGLNAKKLNPLLGRTFLQARDPPQPVFDHIEYGPSPSLADQESKESKYGNGRMDQANVKIITNSFKLNADQISALKAKSKENGNMVNYSTYEILAGHVWKCACRARALPVGQESKLYMATSGRSRLQPPIPPNFFGNVVFAASALVRADELVSKPVWYAASKIHHSLARMDDSYLKSAIDFLELQPDLSSRGRGTDVYGSPNLGITSWVRLPLYDADFGWGRPIYVGPAGISFEGKSYILPASGDDNDKSLLVAIALQFEDMKVFEKLLYDI